jgi:teichoic acid transport system ATP-binding protein
MAAPDLPSPTATASSQPDAIPSVVASHVDIVYRVYGAGRGKKVRGGDDLVSRWLDRGRRHVGVREVHAVKDVSFVAYQGQSIGIIGRNGSGKSTLLRAVAGLIPPTKGEIYLGGRAALLGVDEVLIRKLTGGRNVMIGGQALGLSRQEVRERYRDIVRFADIGEFINMPMNTYSSGMAARLRFAISTATVPDILVVDEALATGDAEFKTKASARIEKIRESAGTVFLVSHSNATVTNLCERVLWMEQGRLVMDGPADEVVGAYAEASAPAKKPDPRKKKRKPPEPEPESEPESEGRPGAADGEAAGG